MLRALNGIKLIIKQQLPLLFQFAKLGNLG